jgi:uncharacterized membrane protein HdeD (DUF308 family)
LTKQYSSIFYKNWTQEEKMSRMESWMAGEWWVLLIRGIVAILLGIFALMNTTAAAMVIVIWLGLYAIVDGVLKIYATLYKRRKGADLWPGVISGLAGIAVGVAIFVWPELTVVVLLALIATRAIIQGISDILSAIRSRKELRGLWFALMMLGGIAEVIFGIWMIFQPLIGGLTVLAVIGIYAIVVGIILIFRSLEVLGGGGGSEASAY